MIRPRPHLESVYRTPEDTESRLPYLRLDMNERIVPIPEQVVNRFRELLTPEVVMTYPEFEPLYQKLAEYIGVEREQLFLVPGSDAGIKTVYETYIDPGDPVLLHLPSFAMHEVYCGLFQARLMTVPYDRQLRLDIQAYVDAITPETRLVLIENPNGFIGSTLPHDAIRAVVEKARRCNALVLLDEAYFLFSGQTIQPFFLEFDNVIIARSFSKDLGIAGLRCGYLLSQKANIQSLYKVKSTYGVSSASIAFALALLEFPEQIKKYVDQVQAGLKYLKQTLGEMGLATAGGEGNFLIAYLGEKFDVPTVIRELKSQSILVRRPFQVENLRGWLRIGGGSIAQMQRFAPAFAQALHDAGWRRENYVPPEGIL